MTSQSSSKPHFLIRRFAHPWMPSLLYLPLALLLVIISLSYQQRSILSVILFLALGLFTWTFIEYLLHRFIFHLTQIPEPWKNLASGLHMAHHRSTDAEDLILAPPFVSLMFGGILYLFFALCLQSWANAAFMEAGLFIGYVIYEWMHFAAHCYQAHFSFGKYLKAYHLKHHFKNPKSAFGVTTPLWDFLFKTQ